MRLIDADAIDFSAIKDPFDRTRAKIIIMGQPTVGIMYDCSLCENRILDNGHPWNYCPNCGAKMDGGAD